MPPHDAIQFHPGSAGCIRRVPPRQFFQEHRHGFGIGPQQKQAVLMNK
jgi:hypothetical protein